MPFTGREGKQCYFPPSLVDLCTGPTGFLSFPLPLTWDKSPFARPPASPLGHYDSNDNPHHFPDPPAISAPTGPRRRMHTHTHVTRHLSKHANRPKLLRTGLLACLSKSLKINANRTHSPPILRDPRRRRRTCLWTRVWTQAKYEMTSSGETKGGEEKTQEEVEKKKLLARQKVTRSSSSSFSGPQFLWEEEGKGVSVGRGSKTRRSVIFGRDLRRGRNLLREIFPLFCGKEAKPSERLRIFTFFLRYFVFNTSYL